MVSLTNMLSYWRSLVLFAGLAVGYWKDLSDVSRNWALDREFSPGLGAAERDRRYRGWQKAVGRSLDFAERGTKPQT